VALCCALLDHNGTTFKEESAMPDSSNPFVISYLTLRKAVGIIGIALPFVLVFGKILVFDSPGIETSISAYYYTGMRNVLVGSLCAIAVFMISYHGPERADDLSGDLACLFALGVALFPVAPEANATPQQDVIGGVHYFFAACLFLTLAYFCLVLFRKKAPQPTLQKLQRNKVYAVCGGIILACIVLIIAAGLLPVDSPVRRLSPKFWLESIAVVAFGVSWLTKGEAILKDEVRQPPEAQAVVKASAQAQRPAA
jgi:hypothetical protein